MAKNVTKKTIRLGYGRVATGPDPNIAPHGAYDLSANNPESKKYLWSGRILHVDTETMCCSLALDSSVGEFHDIPLPASAGGGPRSWAGVIPEPGTKVIVGWRKFGNRTHLPVIIEVLTSGVFPGREFEPFMSLSPEEAAEALQSFPDLDDDPRFNWSPVRLKLRKAYPGEFLASSSGGADIYLSRDVNLSNRAGNELILRDSDQSVIIQAINEFTSNAAGTYRRGIIKRNAFTFYQDLFPLTNDEYLNADTQNAYEKNLIPKDSPAFPILRNAGLIDENGKRTIPYADAQEYPYIVTGDGQRINYVVTGESNNSFADFSWAYIEDRKELRHYSNGIMAVTEEGDGFNIDFPTNEIYIEDVHGTVVGNDFSTEAGRPLYKKVLKMKVFNDPSQGEVNFAPVFEGLDQIQDYGDYDSLSLARLYRIQSPSGSNQYAFGINKQGRVFLHIPASQSSSPDENGKSLDANIVGLVKAIIGKDPNTELSADIIMNGGLNAEIGRGPKGSSITLTLHGPIKKNIIGDDNLEDTPTEETNYGGSISKSVSGQSFEYVRGAAVRVSGAQDATEADSIVHNAGAGGYKQLVAGDHGVTVLGKSMEMYALPKLTNFALGSVKLSLAGVDSSTMLAGGMLRTVGAGVGIADSVVAGNIFSSVATGNMLMNVGAGNLGVTCGSGNLALTAAAGPAAITSSLTATITAGTSTFITSPFTKIGTVSVGGAVAGIPGPPSPHFDYITGLPIMGIPTVVIG